MIHDKDDAVYDNTAYMVSHRRQRRTRKLALAIPEAVNKIGQFKSVIDLGCATGYIVAGFIKYGYDVFGVDRGKVGDFLDIPKDKFIRYDLREPFHPPKQFDVCLSTETAEHMEEKYADVFADNVCRCADNIMFSAAQPRQECEGHYNLQFKQWWIDKFKLRGYEPDDAATKIYHDTLYTYGRTLLRTWRCNATFFRKKK